MHRCLQVTELVGLILDATDKRSELAAMARTSHSFSEPALNLLWGKWADLVHFTRLLLPSELLASRSISGKFSELMFTRALEAADWDVLNKYTFRLRKISSENFGSTQNIYRTLSESCPWGVLFPNIRSVQCIWGQANVEMASNFLQLAGPNLQALDLVYHSVPLNVRGLNPILRQLPTRFPHLRELSCQTWTFEPIGNTFSDVLCDYHSLRRLELGRCVTLTPCVIRHFIGSQYLEHLDWVCNDIEACKPPPDTSAERAPFQRLRYWKQHSNTLKPFLQILLRLAPRTELETLALSVASIEDGNEALILFSAIERILCLNALKELHLELGSAASRPIESTHLEPLFAFRNLRELSLVPCSGDRLLFDFDDEDLRDIARRWPGLKLLELRTDPARVKMAGFLAIVQGCRDLRILGLSFEISTRGIEMEEFRRSVEPHQSLVQLGVSNCTFDDPMGISGPLFEYLVPKIPGMASKIEKRARR